MKRLATLHFLLTKIAWGSKGEWLAAFNAIAKGNTKPIAPTLAAIKQYDEQGRTSEYQEILDAHPESEKLKQILFPNKSSSTNFKDNSPEWGEENTDNWGFDEEDTTYGYKYDPKKGWDSLSKQEQRVAYEDFADMFEFNGKIEELNEEQKMRAFKLYKYGDAFFGDPMTEEEEKREEENRIYQEKSAKRADEIENIIKETIRNIKLKIIEKTGIPIYKKNGEFNLNYLTHLTNVSESMTEALSSFHKFLFNYNDDNLKRDKEWEDRLFTWSTEQKKYKDIDKSSPLYKEYKEEQKNPSPMAHEENLAELKKAFDEFEIEWPAIFDSKKDLDLKLFVEMGL